MAEQGTIVTGPAAASSRQRSRRLLAADPRLAVIMLPVQRCHLSEGARRHCEQCPVALALGGFLADLGHHGLLVVVGNRDACVVDDAGEVIAWDLDPGTQAAIAAFDAGGGTGPWTAVLTRRAGHADAGP